MGDKLRDWMVANYPAEKAESPMEELLWAGWEMAKHRMLFTPEAGVHVKLQKEVGKYRADFLFSINDAGTNKRKELVVEVDGHDFHERTKEQAARDRSRDRWMAENGYDVMRFTGSEVYANPFQCAHEIAERLYKLRYGMSSKRAIAEAGFAALRRILED